MKLMFYSDKTANLEKVLNLDNVKSFHVAFKKDIADNTYIAFYCDDIMVSSIHKNTLKFFIDSLENGFGELKYKIKKGFYKFINETIDTRNPNTKVLTSLPESTLLLAWLYLIQKEIYYVDTDFLLLVILKKEYNSALLFSEIEEVNPDEDFESMNEDVIKTMFNIVYPSN